MRLATLYGVKPDGKIQHISTNEAGVIVQKYKAHNPQHFSHIGFFDSHGKKKLRRVMKSERPPPIAKMDK
jgi:hypothetical protein